MPDLPLPRAAPALEDLDQVRLLMEEIQLLLSEKRTSLSVLRTGIAVLLLPLSVGSFLIATSHLYGARDVLHLLLPVLANSGGLVALAGHLILNALRRIRSLDQRIGALRGRSATVTSLLGAEPGQTGRTGLPS
jgi:hypothetical protein